MSVRYSQVGHKEGYERYGGENDGCSVKVMVKKESRKVEKQGGRGKSD